MSPPARLRETLAKQEATAMSTRRSAHHVEAVPPNRGH
eukprot:CAMPEP_0179219978 /NCGR_PEP_ID=MMETSP0797-20121207/5341_1 /TAXON_ID=47934 /ORGANISM="Dinophysis acuminata, Strain DAEP01" /LENGTH=37 /DNA_ID= /DNA_START= /DNA_END= /DNA_ORIENTATION=